MLEWISALFSKDVDPQLTKLRKLTANKVPYSRLNEDEQVLLMLRLANKTHDDIAVALNCSLSSVAKIENSILLKLNK